MHVHKFSARLCLTCSTVLNKPSSRGVVVSTTDRHQEGRGFKPPSKSEIHGEIRCSTTLAVDGRLVICEVGGARCSYCQ